MLIVDAEVDGVAGLSLRIDAGRIADLGPSLSRVAGEPIVQAHGGAVIPGLHDHHVHLRSAVAARSSIALDPATVAQQGGLAEALGSADHSLAGGEWLRGVGASGPAADVLDRHALDAVIPDRPVRVQHRTGELWVLNSAAIDVLGVDAWQSDGVEREPGGTPNGRLWRLDGQLRDALGEHWDQTPGLNRLSVEALRRGITGFTDAGADRTRADVDALDRHVAAGDIRQRVTLMAGPDLRAMATMRVRLGPMKIVLDDTSLPTEGALAAQIGRAHQAGIPVAVHCVTAAQLVVTTAALLLSGSFRGDRIEHAGIVPPGYAKVLADLGLTVVTQPGFLAARGDDYLRDVPNAEQPWLYPCASLIAAGVGVAAGSDAPFGPIDPWTAMAAAVNRQTQDGLDIGSDERVDPATALALYLGSADAPETPRRVARGEAGDLCLLRAPIAGVLADLGPHQVAAVIIDDEVHTWDR